MISLVVVVEVVEVVETSTPSTDLLVLQGTDEKVVGGGSSLGYSFTMTNHWTHAIHKHAVAKTRLAGQGWGRQL